ETDRERFIGRGGSVSQPCAMRGGLSGTTGNVLDPIVSLRQVLRLEPGATRSVYVLLGAAGDRATALALATPHGVEEAFDRAELRARAELDRAGLSTARAERLEALTVAMLYGDAPALAAAGV